MAVVTQIEEAHKERDKSSSVGTASIEHKCNFRVFWKKLGRHQFLTLKIIWNEALIIKDAGKRSCHQAVNMTGRGVDIILGGQTTSHNLRLHNTAAQASGRNNLRKHQSRMAKEHDASFYLWWVICSKLEKHEPKNRQSLRGRSNDRDLENCFGNFFWKMT